MKERQKEPSQQKNPRKWGMILLMAVLIIVMLVSLWNILGYLLEGRKSEKFAQDLQESAIIIEKDNTDSKDTKKEKEEKEEPIPDAIDFDTLHAISKDAVAWLYAPGGGINYVVAQAGDNDYYLHRLLNGAEAKAGTLFMDYQNHSDFSDWNTMIYGHHMKNGTMFSDLKRYVGGDFLNAHRTVKFETADGIRYFIVTEVLRTDITDAWYDRITAEDGSRCLVLSTCYGSGKDGRLLIIAAET